MGLAALPKAKKKRKAKKVSKLQEKVMKHIQEAAPDILFLMKHGGSGRINISEHLTPVKKIERTAPPPEPTIFGKSILEVKMTPEQIDQLRAEKEKYVGPDLVNHPSHYNSGKIEVIEAIEDWGLGYHLGNTVKYVARAGKKDPKKEIEDLEKGAWYLNRKILNLKAARDGTPVAKPNDTSVKR